MASHRSADPWRLLALLLFPLMASAMLPARASSPEAWAAYDRQVRAACLRASGLKTVRILGQRIDLSTLGLSTFLLEGVYPQPHMQRMQGRELCVYEQRSGRAEVTEANGWRVAPAGGGGSSGR